MKAREGFVSPGAGVTGGCQLLDMIVGNQTGFSVTLTLRAGHCCRLCFNDKENEADRG